MTLDDINKMLTEREQARVDRDYGKADGIRDELRQKCNINIDDRARIFTTQDGKVHPRPDARGNFSEPPSRLFRRMLCGDSDLTMHLLRQHFM